jgi:hypothetical protein
METLQEIRKRFPDEWYEFLCNNDRSEGYLLEHLPSHPDYPILGTLIKDPDHVVFDFLYGMMKITPPTWISKCQAADARSRDKEDRLEESARLKQLSAEEEPYTRTLTWKE